METAVAFLSPGLRSARSLPLVVCAWNTSCALEMASASAAVRLSPLVLARDWRSAGSIFSFTVVVRVSDWPRLLTEAVSSPLGSFGVLCPDLLPQPVSASTPAADAAASRVDERRSMPASARVCGWCGHGTAWLLLQQCIEAADMS